MTVRLMNFAFKFSRNVRRSELLPPEIYVPLVDSLYKDGQTLFLGTIFVVGSMLATYWTSGEPLLLGCAIAIIFVACLRGFGMHAYSRARSTIKNNKVARRWESRYVIGAATSVGLLGIWCFVAFAKTPDPYSHLVSFSMTIAYVVGVFGRNFGNSRFVVVQILCAWIPMTTALLAFGSLRHWIFAGLLIPFFLAVRSIAERLRLTLLDAVVTSRDMSMLARRFDTALNNMPHGLCMFDAGRRILVANQKVNEQFGLPPDFAPKGLSLRQLVDSAVQAGLVSNSNGLRLSQDLDARLSGAQQGDFTVNMENGRTLEFTVQPMENGGTVLLAEDITERKVAEARINHLARFDALTGLPNRTTFREQLERALTACRPDHMCAVHFIDLDQFKQVNDTLGHTYGDMLLVAVAKRLQAVVRDADVIARFGGDEFVVLQSPVKSVDEGSALAARILQTLTGAYKVDGHEVPGGASIGIAIAPNDGVDPDLLLRRADMALYQVKSEGRGSWRWFKPKMEAKAQARRNLELDLRKALESEGFELDYQPIFDLRTKRILACEALLRWDHDGRGTVMPAEFIPVAEEMGLIVELGNQVLRMACLECRRWPGDIRVAVNFSSIQFARSNVPAIVRETLAATNLPAKRLEVEITETTLLQDTHRNRAALRELKTLGVNISLDDFGTGYSSLSYLHSFPLDKVKIDQSFLEDLGNNKHKGTLLRGIARLSADLGLRVVVEGIETSEQFDLIAAQDTIDEVQGYLLGRPVPAAEIRKLLYATHVASAQLEEVA
jgi:diguanylate cyclase (GGDEF)-like protein